MRILVKNSNWSLLLCLNLLKFFGFLVPGNFSKITRIFLNFYWAFWFILLVGIYIVVQSGDIIQIWGNLSFMISSSFLLFTNLALGGKIVNAFLRRDAIQVIIDDSDRELTAEDRPEGKKILESCDRETTRTLYVYFWLSGVTIIGWAASAEKDQLPLRAWYPYDASKSPAYELSYAHQVIAVILAAIVNVSLDTLVTSLMAVCRCRLRLLTLSLRNLCIELQITERDLISPEQEKNLDARLRHCVRQHQQILEASAKIETCFTESILAQFSVSIVIICVTAYQLAVEVRQKHFVRVIAMLAYLLVMMLQVFLYCYQGDRLSNESSRIAGAAFECPWYACSVRFRRALLVVMVRSRRVAQLTAGGFTTLSLTCFTSIIKASYTFFTVLQQVEDRQQH